MGERLWHRVTEHGQPPRVPPPSRIAWRYSAPDTVVSLVPPVGGYGDNTEWCVVDLPTGYAPKPAPVVDVSVEGLLGLVGRLADRSSETHTDAVREARELCTQLHAWQDAVDAPVSMRNWRGVTYAGGIAGFWGDDAVFIDTEANGGDGAVLGLVEHSKLGLPQTYRLTTPGEVTP